MLSSVEVAGLVVDLVAGLVAAKLEDSEEGFVEDLAGVMLGDWVEDLVLVVASFGHLFAVVAPLLVFFVQQFDWLCVFCRAQLRFDVQFLVVLV